MIVMKNNIDEITINSPLPPPLPQSTTTTTITTITIITIITRMSYPDSFAPRQVVVVVVPVPVPWYANYLHILTCPSGEVIAASDHHNLTLPTCTPLP